MAKRGIVLDILFSKPHKPMSNPSFRPRDRAPKTDKETVGVGEWLLTIPFMMIPILNLFLAALLGYMDKTSQTKKNFYWAVIIYSFFSIFLFL